MTSAPTVNTLTAKPLLEYLLASEGLEPPGLVFARVWPVFCHFLTVPDQEGGAVASYQAMIARENADYAELVIRFARQVSDDAGGWGDLTRSVFVQFMFEGPFPGLAAEECWLNDCPDLDGFRQAVEALPTFIAALDLTCTDGSILVEEQEHGA